MRQLASNGHLKLFRQSFILGGKGKETAMDSFELNKIIGAILGTLLLDRKSVV